MITYVTIHKVEAILDSIEQEDHLVTFKCVVCKNNQESFTKATGQAHFF